MSSTFSSWVRERSANGYAPRTRSCSSATSISSSAAIATICCASTSSGLRGIFVSSISPSRIARATTADSSRSARNFGKIRPFETACELVAGAADSLQTAGDRLRRLDLDHEVDRAHVDPELERRGGDEARDPARLQILLDEDPLLAREAAVVGAGDLALGELVQAQREPLGEAAVVDEDDRRAVRLDELEQLRVHRRPDRRDGVLGAPVADLALGEQRVGERRGRAELAQILDGNDDLKVELLARAGVDELDRPAAGDEAADLLERPLRGREPDALDRLLDEPLQALDREREVRAALGAGDGVHLVEDQRLDTAERLARGRGEHQEERLGRRDQDVRRLLDELAALLRRRVAGANSDAEARLEPGERPAQVPLDVVVERLERRDVQDAQALARARVQPVDRVEERGERLARAGRRLDQDVAAGRDRRPAEPLRRRRLGERALEPGSRGRREGGERVHPGQGIAPADYEQVFV